MQVFSLDQIKAVLPTLNLIPIIEAGFAAYVAKRAIVPPVGELLMPKGEAHIKYGYMQNDDYYVIKIASGFYGNGSLGLPTSNGMMLLFSQQTGEPVAILLDEGALTDIRTAVAGAIAAKYLAPQQVERIGIVGTGIQARLQLQYLQEITPCRDVLVWGRSAEKCELYVDDMQRLGFNVASTQNAAGILQSCNLIVTTTPATAPLLFAADLRPGTHITAVGSDTAHKQELDAAILARADLVVADSISQCLSRGEIFQALQSNQIQQDDLVELGQLVWGNGNGRSTPDQITIADLTGVAVQDIQIAKAVYSALQNN